MSNNIGNKFSEICEVVYLTTAEKKPLPTHVNVIARVPSIAMCEQVTSVSQSRLVEYIRTCNTEEMEAIDRALMISLGLNPEKPNEQVFETEGMIDDLNRKLECAEKCMEKLNAENAGLCLKIGDLEELLDKAEHDLENKNAEISDLVGKLKKAESEIPVFPAEVEMILKVETQRDMYKELYENMLERMIG